jgi:hypothetical protein
VRSVDGGSSPPPAGAVLQLARDSLADDPHDASPHAHPAVDSVGERETEVEGGLQRSRHGGVHRLEFVADRRVRRLESGSLRVDLGETLFDASLDIGAVGDRAGVDEIDQDGDDVGIGHAISIELISAGYKPRADRRQWPIPRPPSTGMTAPEM